MEHLADAASGRAKDRGQKLMATEPRAASARFDQRTGRLAIGLINGCTYLFPVHLVENLRDAEPGDLSVVGVERHGFNLNWPRLDVDLYVPAPVAGVFGTHNWMAKALARRAGSSTSPAKAAAARANGAKGGWHRKRT